MKWRFPLLTLVATISGLATGCATVTVGRAHLDRAPTFQTTVPLTQRYAEYDRHSIEAVDGHFVQINGQRHAVHDPDSGPGFVDSRGRKVMFEPASEASNYQMLFLYCVPFGFAVGGLFDVMGLTLSGLGTTSTQFYGDDQIWKAGLTGAMAGAVVALALDITIPAMVKHSNANAIMGYNDRLWKSLDLPDDEPQQVGPVLP